MAFTQAQLTALEEAYASGALEVRDSSGRTVRYESREALKARLDELRAELGERKSGLKITATRFDRGVR
jgi:hypothetical protein